LLSATSDPIGSQVFINGELKTATNNTLNLDPGWYMIKIIKEGYIPWEKKIRIQGEVVANTDPFLFPANPSLSPLTNSGVEQPILSPDGTKIAYIIPVSDNITAKKSGLWVYELVERPLGFNRDPRQLGTTLPEFNFSKSTLSWSPDSMEIMVDNGTYIRLYQTNKTEDFQDVSLSYQTILKDWEDMRLTKEKQKLATYKKELADAVSNSAKILSFSPDETKMLYEATASATLPQVIKPPLIGTNSVQEQRTITPGKLYVYDSHEDKNYWVLDKSELISPKTSPQPTAKSKIITPNLEMPCRPAASAEDNCKQGTANFELANVHWFPTSNHLVLTLEGKIDIMDFDRTNWITVYSGPFVGDFIAPWPNGSRIIIMTNLNSKVSTLPNLYTVNLR